MCVYYFCILSTVYVHRIYPCITQARAVYTFHRNITLNRGIFLRNGDEQKNLQGKYFMDCVVWWELSTSA